LILAGDAEKPVWDKILATVPAADLKCDVLKAAHYGRESGFSEDAVRAMDPKYVICSVGNKPDTDASDEYAALGATVLSTRFNGSIELRLETLGNGRLTDHRGAVIGSL
jgi:competence protein ComEC